MDEYRALIEIIGLAIEGAGVAVIVFGALYATWRFTLRQQPTDGMRSYKFFRQDIGRSILLGLEFLIAGDIIRSVAVTPTLDGVTVLGLIVLIRTFLSMALHVEVEGCWPWQLQDNERQEQKREQVND